MAATTEQRLDTHEQVCALRYQNIELQFRSSNARLKRIEHLKIMLAKDFWTTEDLSPLQAAAA